jgi:ribosome-associated heat shock protein Hsp15
MNEPSINNLPRLDKFLWAARFYKTRQLAAEEIDKGRVQVNGQAAKPGRHVRVGDVIVLRQNHLQRTIVVSLLSSVRGPASVAQTLYQETPESMAARERAQEARRLSPEPAAAQTQGRPTKRDRRDIERLQQSPPKAAWGERWSASLDD